MKSIEAKRGCATMWLPLIVVHGSGLAQVDKPLALNPKEISCTLVGAEVQGKASADSWGPLKRTVTSGTVGKLECKLGSDPKAKPKEIPLASKSFTPKTGIETRDFGAFAIEFGTSMETLSYTLKLTSSQKEALKAFLNK